MSDLAFDPELDMPLASPRQQARTLQIETDYARHVLARLAREKAAGRRTLGRRVTKLVGAIGVYGDAVDNEMTAFRSMKVAATRCKDPLP